jgi:hypothetical protein
MWAFCVIFKKLTKENNGPISENSPNVVTLPVSPVPKTKLFTNLQSPTSAVSYFFHTIDPA